MAMAYLISAQCGHAKDLIIILYSMECYPTWEIYII